MPKPHKPQTIDKIARDILRREGGYVNDPDDLGGATKYGVTLETMRRLGLDVNHDGQVTQADVKLLTRKQAVQIFKDHYFYRPRLDRLPAPLQPAVFDMQVNSGSNAIKILQNLLNDAQFDLIVDGILGAHSLSAAARFCARAPDYAVDAYGIARRNYYYALGDRRAASRKYIVNRRGGKGGWIRRAEDFISRPFHLSLRDHRERTAQWD